ncbi:MAG: bifunctional phosphoglucose/phosphomannose isomerase [Candidatus Bipolaricaulota bacterium]|nr:bifunctional phosphoglucose/phosphomannose isomerase [Candidatus Bipolaricaulota bacterium]
MKRLDDENLRTHYDRQGMIQVLDRFSAQCAAAIEQGERFKIPSLGSIDKVIVCGMGGSAMAGEIARRFAKVPVFVNRSYTLPAFADSHTLLAAISYSGNTAETLSSLSQGLERGAMTIAISSGGKLSQISKAQGLPFLQIPGGYQPRAVMGYLALPLLVILSKLGLLATIGPWEVLLQELSQVKNRCAYSVPSAENPAKQLAQTLHGRIPLIYGTVDNTDVVAMRWKTQINENAKQPAFWNVFPELNHNEIVALARADLLANQHVLLLENDYDLPENRARMEIMMPLFEKNKVLSTVVKGEGESELSQILSQIYLGDYVSYYLALLNEVDPSPVVLIEEFKKALAKREASAKKTT